MDVFSVLTLAGGIAFFLYGMHVLSTGLEKMAGGSLEQIIKKLTSDSIKGLAFGAGITIALQSSTTVTVMLVGLVNSGIMGFSQAVPIIMGTNIGTTITAWILSLVGLESGNIFVNMLKPENFSLLFALAGIVLMMMSKKPKRRDIGSVFIGFAILMFGMKLMSGAVAPLADKPSFISLMTVFKNPILAVLLGAVITIVIQSSAASVGILQALSLTGGVTYGMAIPIIMGQNIGTCLTALVSSIGTSKNAKKVAFVHLAFNVIGTMFFLIVFIAANAIFRFPIVEEPIGVVGISIVHSLFNIGTTALLFPFPKKLEAIANFALRDSVGRASEDQLDTRLLETPSVAISACDDQTSKMAELSKKAVLDSIALMGEYNEKSAEQILEDEDTIDRYEDRLGTFLVKLSSKSLSESDTRTVSKMLHAIGDFERLGDHAVNISQVAKELHTKKLWFSEHGDREINVLFRAVKEILDLTIKAYVEKDLKLAELVEPLEQVIDEMIHDIKQNHIERLQHGVCSIEMGFILSDLLTNCERVSDHCSNIAVNLLETSRSSFRAHNYLSEIRHGNIAFDSAFDRYKAKYTLS